MFYCYRRVQCSDEIQACHTCLNPDTVLAKHLFIAKTLYKPSTCRHALTSYLLSLVPPVGRRSLISRSSCWMMFSYLPFLPLEVLSSLVLPARGPFILRSSRQGTFFLPPTLPFPPSSTMQHWQRSNKHVMRRLAASSPASCKSSFACLQNAASAA